MSEFISIGDELHIQCTNCDSIYRPTLEKGERSGSRRRRQRSKPSKEEAPITGSRQQAIREAFDTLELPPNATREQLAASFKRLRSEYHPDKTACLGKALRDLADVKAKQINAARDLLIKEGRLEKRAPRPD